MTQSSSKNKFCLNLKHGEESDNTFVLIEDELTAAYDFPGDNVKMFSENIVSTKIFSVYGNEKLAQLGINKDLTANPIQLGYIAVSAGEYTLSLASYWQQLDDVENIYLYDGGNMVADLMRTDYTFSTDAGENTTRFAIVINMGHGAPMNIHQTTDHLPLHTVKVLSNGQVRIMRNGAQYNILGQESK